MDKIISAAEAKQICDYERLLPVFRRICSAAIHCEYIIHDERLYQQDIDKLIALGYKVSFAREHHSGLSEYDISWL
jgi:hypothetical protein